MNSQQARLAACVRSGTCRFGIASGLATLLFVCGRNTMRGMPIGADMEFQGTFVSLLHPYALLWRVCGGHVRMQARLPVLENRRRTAEAHSGLDWDVRIFSCYISHDDLTWSPYAGTHNFRGTVVWIVVTERARDCQYPRAIFSRRPGYALRRRAAITLTFLFAFTVSPSHFSSLNPTGV